MSTKVSNIWIKFAAFIGLIVAINATLAENSYANEVIEEDIIESYKKVIR
jgi:hypothetical protein